MIHLKSEPEIEKLRRSGDLVSRTLAAVAAHIRPGVSTRALDQVAEDFIRKHGARPAFKGYRVGANVFPASICTSINQTVVHGIPGDETLEEGDIVSVDCGVVLDGFYGDSAYTFAVGEIGDETRRLLRVTYDALVAGIREAVAGNRVGDIGSAVSSKCGSAGFGVVYDLVGHGIGRSLHEAPQVPNVGRRGTGKRLSEGLSICIEPMVNAGTAEVFTRPDGWTVDTADNKPSAHYEHMVLVKKEQAEVLTTFAYIEQVVSPPYAAADAQSEATTADV